MRTVESEFFIESTYDRLFQVLREMVQLYSDYVVDINDDGTISKIHGHILYREELRKLQETVFEDQVVADYDQQMATYFQKLENIEKEAVEEIKNKKLVPLFYLYRVFQFNAFEKFVFLLSFAASVESQFKKIFALLADDFEKEYPSIELCAQICSLDPVQRKNLCREMVENFPIYAILYNNVATAKENGIIQRPLIISERIFHFMWDVGSENERLNGLISTNIVGRDLDYLFIHRDLVEGLDRICKCNNNQKLIMLHGDKGSGRKSVFRVFGDTNRIPVLFVDCEKIESFYEKGELRKLIQEIRLESLLKGKAFIVFSDFYLEEKTFHQLEKIIWYMEDYADSFGVAYTSEMTWLPKTRFEKIELSIDNPTLEQRTELWKYHLEQYKKDLGLSDKDIRIMLDVLPAQYVLTPGAIASAIQTAIQIVQRDGLKKVTRDIFNESCQKQIAHMLGNDATKIRTIHLFDDLVLPPSQKKLLVDACNRIRYRNKIFSEWGFQEKVAYGKGTSMIFYGPPGTGKTMGAQVLAKELGLELYKVDMAKVMSKYVGESEKKLGEIFEHGKKSQSILFFDEADALFGKRSEVKDSQDKYANASTAFLLQKIEEYEGIIILATNLLQNFDAAFMRRFQYIIEFPFPDEQQREEIWRNVFPKKMPCGELDYEFMAKQFKLSGSQIKNIALAAAFMVADKQRPVEMADIFIAMKRENSKVGKNMIASDFGGYYYLMEEGEQ